jgi:hypothetical protein
LTDGLAWRACRAGANHPSEHHLPRETFAAHADDVACPPQECGVNDVAEGREAEVAGQLGSRDAIPLGYVVELPYTLPMTIPFRAPTRQKNVTQTERNKLPRP